MGDSVLIYQIFMYIVRYNTYMMYTTMLYDMYMIYRVYYIVLVYDIPPLYINYLKMKCI